jgi:ATP-dependent helicase/nuclease subunit B
MLQPVITLPPSAAFWDAAAGRILESADAHDFSALRVVVPTVGHIGQLQAALARRIEGAFIPPRICTMTAWLALQPPAARIASDSERLMSLYAELRQHAWLKKLFSARSNTDLLPLAQTLLTLCDELSQALLPALDGVADGADARWDAALAQLSPGARELLSQETQLVWSVWKTQLDSHDAQVARLAAMLQLAGRASAALIWISPTEPDVFDAAFLQRYAQRQPVTQILLGWQPEEMRGAYTDAWPELFDVAAQTTARHETPTGLALCQATSLEDEAQRAAQTVIDWLVAGKTSIAIIAQDRVVARRIRALLERAEVVVADETGWKLSTTRAAAALAAWFEVVSGRADTVALLDLLKSPFVLAEVADKSTRVIAIEHALRRANVGGGWQAALAALQRTPAEQDMIALLAQQAALFKGRQTLADWLAATEAMLDALQMRAPLAADPAGMQLLSMLAALAPDCAALGQPYSFAEWRAFMNLRMEALPFIGAAADRRVMMLPLNGARLRRFDAVLMVGADAEHLPSQAQETLFFANAVRRELGLATRESRQRQQLRDFVELLQVNAPVVLTWQGHRNGEPNPLSPWIARLQLSLQRGGAAPLAAHLAILPARRLTPQVAHQPAPSAPDLLPQRLSASAYNTLMACPYQFFATRMLGLSAIDELSELPEKRDYGDWLHRILKNYHDALNELATPVDERLALMMRVSDDVFDPELAKNAAALGFYVRWKKAAPAYLAWANARQESGWQFAFGELALERQLVWDEGAMTLHGRIDRIDRNEAGELAVLDYKTNELTVLKKRLNEGEDQQLAFYGLLHEAPLAHAHYVALEAKGGKTGDAPAGRYAEWQAALRTQVIGNLQAIRQGAPLPASGIETTCQYCDVRGLCRKGAW